MVPPMRARAGVTCRLSTVANTALRSAIRRLATVNSCAKAGAIRRPRARPAPPGAHAADSACAADPCASTSRSFASFLRRPSFRRGRLDIYIRKY